MIFKGSMSTASKSQGKKLERGINLAQCTKPERRMKWSETDISFRLEYQLETELSNWNLPFMVKLLIGCHKVAKTLIDNGASINLIMRKTLGPKGIITFKTNQWDTLACENASLSHAGRFGDLAAQDQVAKATKTQGNNGPHKTSAPKPPTKSTPWADTTQKGTYVASTSTQPPAD
jgi:hypothetical protein